MPPISLEEMPVMHFWTRAEKNVLVSMLLANSRVMNLSNTNIMKGVIEGLSERLTHMFRCPITPVDITKRLQAFNHRFVCFVWFIARNDVLYEIHSNRVFSIYTPGVYVPRETEVEHIFRVVGEPFYVCFDHLFHRRRMDQLDYSWLFNVFSSLE